MQQIYLLTSWDIAPCGVVTKDYGEGTLFPLSRQEARGIIYGDNQKSVHHHDTNKTIITAE